MAAHESSGLATGRRTGRILTERSTLTTVIRIVAEANAGQGTIITEVVICRRRGRSVQVAAVIEAAAGCGSQYGHCLR